MRALKPHSVLLLIDSIFGIRQSSRVKTLAKGVSSNGKRRSWGSCVWREIQRGHHLAVGITGTGRVLSGEMRKPTDPEMRDYPRIYQGKTASSRKMENEKKKRQKREKQPREWNWVGGGTKRGVELGDEVSAEHVDPGSTLVR